MGKLIDADVLREEVYSWGMNDYEPSDFTDAIDDAPTVEAIPKDQYKARLKADMAAMLEEIGLQFDKISFCRKGEWKTVPEIKAEYKAVVREKINELVGDQGGENDKWRNDTESI